MPTVKFTYALKRFFPNLQPVEVIGTTVEEVVTALEEHYPGMRGYILDDDGSLRKHVNIFIGNELINDKTALTDTVATVDEVYIMQALSGG